MKATINYVNMTTVDRGFKHQKVLKFKKLIFEI